MRRGPRIRTVIAGVAVLAGALIPAATPASAVDIFPSISVDQYPLDFGDVPIGVPTQRTLTVTNNRDETWTTPGLGVPAHFDVLGSNCWNPVPAHGTCIVIIQLLPTVPGRYDGGLQFAVGDGEFVEVPMIANALAPRSAALFPSPGSFGDVPVGTSRDVLVTVANDGSETWQLGEISTSDVSVGVPATECAGTIASGEQCTFVARFTPTAAGAVTATLTLFDEHGDALGGITLTGTGVVPTPLVRPVVTGLSPRRGSVRGAPASPSRASTSPVPRPSRRRTPGAQRGLHRDALHRHHTVRAGHRARQGHDTGRQEPRGLDRLVHLPRLTHPVAERAARARLAAVRQSGHVSLRGRGRRSPSARGGA